MVVRGSVSVLIVIRRPLAVPTLKRLLIVVLSIWLVVVAGLLILLGWMLVRLLLLLLLLVTRVLNLHIAVLNGQYVRFAIFALRLLVEQH